MAQAKASVRPLGMVDKMFDARGFGVAAASLLAAVALGAALGAGWAVAEPRLWDESALKRLDEEIAWLMEERRILKREIGDFKSRQKSSEIFIRSARPALVAGRLSGTDVGVIYTRPGVGEPGLSEVLSESGARLVWRITVKEPWRLDASALIQALMPGGQLLFENLKTQGMIDSWGETVRKPEAVILIIDRGDEVTNGSALLLAAGLSQSQIRVVVAERFDSGPAVGGFRHVAQASVDNVDEVTGQVALILALSGENGVFGRKTGAQRLSPELVAK